MAYALRRYDKTGESPIQAASGCTAQPLSHHRDAISQPS